MEFVLPEILHREFSKVQSIKVGTGTMDFRYYYKL